MTDFTKAREAMVDRQVRPADVTRFPVIEAMLWAPREKFLSSDKRGVAYAGEHVEIAPGRVLLDPRVFAKLLDAAAAGPSDLVLDVACGGGYSAAVLARMTSAVIAVEEDEALADAATRALSELEVDNAAVHTAPLADGCAADGPYDLIVLNGGVEHIPAPLSDQVKEGGRIVGVLLEPGLDGALGAGAVWTKSGGVLTASRRFEATAPVLPGFAAKPAFSF